MSYRKQNKYHAKKVTYKGFTYDSKTEFKYYCYLNRKYKNREDIEIKYHESFHITERFKLGGKVKAARRYTPDFTIYKNNELVKVIDVKGGKATMTADASLRICLFEYKYRIPVTIARYDRNLGKFTEQ